MSRAVIESLGYSFVENPDLPSIVRNWCIGDSILCLIEGEFPYSSGEWKDVSGFLKPVLIERVLKGYRIYAGHVVVDED
jgi:hypothetical protein